MLFSCPRIGGNLPRVVLRQGRCVKFTSNHVARFVSSSSSQSHDPRFYSPKNRSPEPKIASPSNFSTSPSHPLMEDPERLSHSSLDGEAERGRYSKELDVAVRAVQMACWICQKVQDTLVYKADNNSSSDNNGKQVHAKDDHSPVTIAGKKKSQLLLFPLCWIIQFLDWASWVFVVNPVCLVWMSGLMG